MQKFRGGQKLANRSQPFLDDSSPNLGACRLTSFRLLISCSVAEICLVRVQRRSQKAFFSQPVGGKCRGGGVRSKFFK